MTGKKRTYRRCLPAITMLLLSASCRSPLMQDEVYVFSRQQTRCADPWPSGAIDSLTIQNIYHFIDSAGLGGPMLNVWMQPDAPADACTACTCRTGKTIYVSVLKGGGVLSGYYSLGFQQVSGR